MLEDFAVAAIKIGMLGSAEIVGAVAEALGRPSPQPSPAGARGGESLLPPAGEGGAKRRMRAFIVYDPVMIASSGEALSGAGFVEAVRRELLPLVDCLTPNLAEAAALLGEPVAGSEADMARQGAALMKLGPRAVLMKGGHLEGDEAVDLLVTSARRSIATPRRGSPRAICTGPAARCRAPSPPMLFSGAVAGGRGGGQGVRERSDREEPGAITLGAGAGPLIQAKLRTNSDASRPYLS